MHHGYMGKILRIDLTNNKIWIEEQDERFYRKYMGGRGIALYYLLKLISDPNIDAYDPPMYWCLLPVWLPVPLFLVTLGSL